MKTLLAGVAGFLAGAILGYCMILFGWIGYAELFGVFDRDGGKIMGVAFGFAPVGGILAGIAGGVWAAGRVRKARPR